MLNFLINNYQWLLSGLSVAIILFIIKKFTPNKGTKGSSNMINISNNSDRNIIVSESNVNIHLNDLTKGSSIDKFDKIESNPISQIGLGLKEFDSRIETFEWKDILDISLKSIKEEIDRTPAILRKDAWKHYEGIVIRCHLKLLSLTQGENNTAEASFIETGMISPPVNVEISLDTYPFLKIAKVWDKYEITGRITECSLLRIKMNPVIIKPLTKP